MRTTITLDPEVSIKINEIVKKKGLPFKQVINDLLKKALSLSSNKKNSLALSEPTSASFVDNVDHIHLNKILDDLD